MRIIGDAFDDRKDASFMFWLKWLARAESGGDESEHIEPCPAPPTVRNCSVGGRPWMSNDGLAQRECSIPVKLSSTRGDLIECGQYGTYVFDVEGCQSLGKG